MFQSFALFSEIALQQKNYQLVQNNYMNIFFTRFVVYRLYRTEPRVTVERVAAFHRDSKTIWDRSIAETLMP